MYLAWVFIHVPFEMLQCIFNSQKKIQKSRITSELDRVKKDLPLTLLHSLYLPNKKTLLLYEFDQALRPWVKKEVDI